MILGYVRCEFFVVLVGEIMIDDVESELVDLLVAMILQLLDLVETGALLYLRCDRVEIVLVGGGHLEYVRDAVEHDHEYLRVVGGEQVTEGREYTLLQYVCYLFSFAR